ncbi:hypothetical protein B0T11DRAFT_272618 [Plectosphaerella cucumerina]|uniref:Uncharacterized protein n=1 Tax=Plectosphaerella cucumerina TaxID=40658 RepID=A0A8K0X964_9PEZI|nr:hypothetical protein B0T11DRAFT_272618 [Plectosphaerella cucumerina]
MMDHLTMTQSLHIARIRASNSIGLLENYAHPHREPFPTFEELRGAGKELDSIIHTIKMLESYEPYLEVIPTETQRHALGTIEALLTNCAETLDAFTEKVRRFLTSWESADPAGQDGLKPYMQSRFERNDIAALGVLSRSYTSALTIAWLLLSKETSEERINGELADNIDTLMDTLVGQLEGLKLAAQAIQDAGPRNPAVEEGMARTVLALSLCGDVGDAAANLVREHTCTEITISVKFPSMGLFGETRCIMSSTEELAIARGLKVEEDS